MRAVGCQLSAVGFALMAACGPSPGDTGVVCDASAAVSVSVTVVGPEDPTVTWEQGGVESPCEAWPDGTWACGYEVAGDLTIHVTADGWEPWEETVTVSQGECHVGMESVTADMVPTDTTGTVDCTDTERPSVVATVAGSSGETLSSVSVRYQRPDTDAVPPCDDEGDGTWICGWEIAGELTILAQADGHVPDSRSVTIAETADGCHVVTQEIEFLLEWQAD
jgi:hypothetical protein